jgi:hypothetical protein
MLVWVENTSCCWMQKVAFLTLQGGFFCAAVFSENLRRRKKTFVRRTKGADAPFVIPLQWLALVGFAAWADAYLPLADAGLRCRFSMLP